MVNILVADDEAPARRRVIRYLEDLPYVDEIWEATNGDEVIDQTVNKRPDLLLLDVQMPQLNGVEALQQMPPKLIPNVVFITAYDDYALNAFEVGAVDYLVKPFTKDRFLKAIGRALERQSTNDVLSLVNDFGEKQTKKRIICRTAKRQIVINTDDIAFITTEYREVLVFTRDFSKYACNLTIDELMKILDNEKFFRIHRSSIINLDFKFEIEHVADGRYRVVYSNDMELMVSREPSKKLRKVLGF